MTKPTGNPNGRPECPVRAAWTLRYGLGPKRRQELTQSFMAQLSFCKSDEARRLILGISEKGQTGFDGERMTTAQYKWSV